MTTPTELRALLAAATAGPWEFSSEGDALASDGEVLALVGKDGKEVLSIGWGGFSCESDPNGSYPLLEASEGDWALMKAAVNSLPGLLDERDALIRKLRSHCNSASSPGVHAFALELLKMMEGE